MKTSRADKPIIPVAVTSKGTQICCSNPNLFVWSVCLVEWLIVMSVSFLKSAQARESLDFVVEWTQALCGNGSVSRSVNCLMRLANADAVLIVRMQKKDWKTKHIARCCVQQGKIWPSQPQTQAELVIGECISTARPGSVWKLSDLVLSDASPMSHCQPQRPEGLVEVILIPLDVTGAQVDYIELHYSIHPQTFELDLISALAPTLSSGWSKRLPGTVAANSEVLRSHRSKFNSNNRFVPILDPHNPADLSRCEFRVCAMMKEGMTVKTISETLSIGPTTVRSHLSSIFSKTGATSQVELLHLLNRSVDADRGFAQIAG